MVATVQGRSPWLLAWERLRRNKVALGFGVLFVLLVLFCLAAPLWADHVAHTGPNQNHITDRIVVDGQQTYVVAPDGTPLGPGLRGRYLLGADQNGRDVMVRLMYGGRTSIYIGVVAAVITTVFADGDRVAVRLLPRLDRLGAVPDHGRGLGLSGAAARHCAGHHAGVWAASRSAACRYPVTHCGFRS